MNKQSIGVYPGTFDPFTNGHKEIVDEALRLFDMIIIAVGHGSSKAPTLFSEAERIAVIEEIFSGNQHIQVLPFAGLVVEFAARQGATALVRGLRTEADFSYEMPMAITNRKINNSVMTVFIPTSLVNHYVSSSLVREVAMFHGDVQSFVPPQVLTMLHTKFGVAAGGAAAQPR